MSYAVSITQAAAQQLEQSQDKLLSYPSKGVHVGGGIHVDMPDTWDGTGSPPPGWSSYRTSSLKHPTLAQWATPLDANMSAALADSSKSSKLSAPEKTVLTTADAAKVATLPADWTPVVAADAVKGGP